MNRSDLTAIPQIEKRKTAKEKCSQKEKKLRRKRSLLSFLSLTFFSLILLLSNNRIRHGRLLAPQQAGERLGASAVRTEGERERRWTGSVL